MANPIGRALRSRRAGHHTLVWMRDDLQAPENFTLTSSAFEHGNAIPARFRGRVVAANISPALSWSAPPDGTVELVLIVEDPDAPGRLPAVHALASGIDPGIAGIPENSLAKGNPLLLHLGRGPLRRVGWTGPAPIPSHGPHSYVFQLFAVDRAIDLAPGFSRAEALERVAGHVIGRARLDGTYEVS